VSQPSINLLPEGVRARQAAGIRAGRMIGGAILSALVVVVLAGHSHVELTRARENLHRAEERAKLVRSAEARAEELVAAVALERRYIEEYRRIALPLEVSSLVATLVNEMPASVTLDRLDLDASPRRPARMPRARTSAETHESQRFLVGELAGFALSDEEIALLVRRLSETKPFRDVNLDFSRTRAVRGRTAREFRVSFRVDMDAAYETQVKSEQLGDEQFAATRESSLTVHHSLLTEGGPQ
jgi:hypothetical protein